MMSEAGGLLISDRDSRDEGPVQEAVKENKVKSDGWEKKTRKELLVELDEE